MSQMGIDWNAVRGRLRKSEEALQETLSDSPARMKIVFRQRAAQLRKREAKTSVSTPIAALVFRVGEERHAIALSELTEVLAFRDCTPVPGSAPQFLGVINLRGEIRPVLDLARILCGNGAAKSGVVLILRRQAALKVDSAEELRDMQPDEAGSLTLLNVEGLLAATFPGTGERESSR